MASEQNLTSATWRKSSYSGNTGGECVECTTTGHATWRKSSHSGTTGGDCVECTTTGSATWRKSSHSGSTGGDCLEVSPCTPGAVPVRDSKNPTGPVLTFSAPTWTTFISTLR